MFFYRDHIVGGWGDGQEYKLLRVHTFRVGRTRSMRGWCVRRRCVWCCSSTPGASWVAKLCNAAWIGKSVVKHCQNRFEYFMRFLFFFFFFLSPGSYYLAAPRKEERVGEPLSFFLFFVFFVISHEGRQHVLENDEESL